MTVDELRWFLILAETEHVTDAAAVLHITQPTLSRAIARLERRLGAPLFDRESHRLRLNEYGEVFRTYARRALDELATGQDRIAAMLDPGCGTVSLAFPHSFGSWLVPELISAYRPSAPETRFLLRSDSADAVLAALREGSVDLIVTSPEPRAPDIEWFPLRTQRLWLAFPEQHPLAGRDSVALAELAREQFVLLRPEFGLRQITDRLLAAAGVRPDIAMESTELATIGGLVASGIGIAVLPGPAVAGTRLVRIGDSGAYRTIGLAWHGSRHTTGAANRFRAFITTHGVPGSGPATLADSSDV